MPFVKEYLPILKMKQGEITAMKRLKLPLKSRLSPIFDAWPVDMAGKRAAKIGYCASITARLHQLLPIRNFQTLFVDPFFAIEGAPSETPTEVCDALFHVPHAKKKVTQLPAPVYRPTTPASAFSSMDKAAAREGWALVRIRLADTSDPNLPTFLKSLVGRLEGKCKIGLVIDAERRVSKPVSAYATAYISEFQASIDAHTWDRIVVASGSMPPNFSDLTKPGVEYERYDFTFFEEMEKKIPHPVSLSDYGPISPEFEELSFSNPTIAAKIKYLIGKDRWFVAREGVTNRLGGSLAEYVKCAKTIVAKPFFAGQGYSWAEDRLLDAAIKNEAGQHVTWVSVACVRHITKTAEDVSNLP